MKMVSFQPFSLLFLIVSIRFVFVMRIRIHQVAEYGSSLDPETQHWLEIGDLRWGQVVIISVAEPSFFGSAVTHEYLVPEANFGFPFMSRQT